MDGTLPLLTSFLFDFMTVLQDLTFKFYQTV